MMIDNPDHIRNGGDFEEYVLRRRHGPKTELPYIAARVAYEAAKNDQGDWDPCNPLTEVAKKIVEIVKDEIRSITRELHPDVRLYCLVGTTFDQFHRADASIEYTHHGKTYWSLIDFTINPNKINPTAWVIKLEDVLDGSLVNIVTKIALELLEKEKSNMLDTMAWDVSSEDVRL
jgi:hypothetical protein